MFRRWAVILFLSSSLIALTVFLVRTYQDIFDSYLDSRSRALSLEVGESLRLLVDSHVRVLQTLADTEGPHLAGNSKDYLKLATSAVDHYSGFFAVNWIDPDGRIRYVHPLEPNRLALNRNVMDRLQVRAVVEESRRTLKPAMSALFKTFQGVEASALYIPVADRGRLVGWVNGVLDLNGWLSAYLQSRNQDGLFVRLTWSSDPRVPYVFGDRNHPPKLAKTEVQILNQLLSIEVGFSRPMELAKRSEIEMLAVVFGVVLALLVAGLLMSLQFSLRQSQRLARRLKLKSVLVSSLTHDLGTPLTVLNLCVDRLEPQTPQNREIWGRMKKASDHLRQMLDSVRLLNGVESGRVHLEIVQVPLQQAVQEAVEEMRTLSERKGVTVHATGLSPTLRVQADRSTLVLNVLPNVLSNAIKFSRAGGQVVVQAEERGREVHVTITDQGVGMSPDKLKEIFDAGPVDTMVGTGGEVGSGLGLLQVKTFMQIYGGRVEAESQLAAAPGQKSGSVIRLIFRATEGSR